MATVTGLGHVGIWCNDVQAMTEFYTSLLGLTVTDVDEARGMVFLSANPEDEHHELLLWQGREGREDSALQQVSFVCRSLEDVLQAYGELKQRGVAIDMVVTHGNAVAVYFFDPEGNRCEVYWKTGLPARQPYLIPVDLDKAPDEIVADVRRSVEQYGATGVVSL